MEDLSLSIATGAAEGHGDGNGDGPAKRLKKCPTHDHSAALTDIDPSREHRQDCSRCGKRVRYCQRCEGWSQVSATNWYTQHGIGKCRLRRQEDVSSRRKEAAAAQMRKDGRRFVVRPDGVLPPGSTRQTKGSTQLVAARRGEMTDSANPAPASYLSKSRYAMR
jgi:hypothetical protein